MRALTLVALIAVPAAAQTVYSWEDKDGVHYTDDLSQVPTSAKRVEAKLDDAPARKAPSTPVATAPSPAPAPAATPPSAPSGLDEGEWRGRFVSATRRISTLQQNIRALEASLPPRTECVPQPLVPVGSVQVNGATGAPITTTPGSQVVTANGVTTVVHGQPVVSPAARCQINPLYDRLKVQIAEEQVKLKDAEVDLEQLDRAASYAAVPREWRRGW